MDAHNDIYEAASAAGLPTSDLYTPCIHDKVKSEVYTLYCFGKVHMQILLIEVVMDMSDEKKHEGR